MTSTIHKVAFGIAAACAAFAAQPATAQQAEGIKLGIVTFLSGAAAGPFGVPARNAAELTIETLNAGKMPAPYEKKGINGLPIEMVITDEAGGTTKQVTEYRNLVQRANVDAIIGYISSGDCLAIAPLADELKKLTIFFDCGTPRIFEDATYRYLFRTGAHATMDNVALARYLNRVVIATDDERIMQHAESFGANAYMTAPAHPSGTDRCFEAMRKTGKDYKYVLNIQGDEPFIQPEQLRKLMSCFNNPETQIATLVKPLHNIDDILNPNHVKVVLNKDNRAMYFSRSPIPYIRGKETASWADCHQYFKHLGIYAYRTEVLNEVTRLSQSSLEIAESLEQLRWLENGLCIAVEKTDFESIAIDTPEDLEKLKGIEFAD